MAGARNMEPISSRAVPPTTMASYLWFSSGWRSASQFRRAALGARPVANLRGILCAWSHKYSAGYFNRCDHPDHLHDASKAEIFQSICASPAVESNAGTCTRIVRRLLRLLLQHVASTDCIE